MTYQEPEDAHFDEIAERIANNISWKSNSQISWEILSALQCAYCLGLAFREKPTDDK